MPTSTEAEAFLDALNARADVAPHVRKAILRAHRGKVPVLRAHALDITNGALVEIGEWTRVAKRAPRFVVIAWRLDGARVDHATFSTLAAACAHARAAHSFRLDGALAAL